MPWTLSRTVAVTVNFHARAWSAPVRPLWYTAPFSADNDIQGAEGSIGMSVIEAWIAPAARQKLVRQQVDLGPLGAEEVEVQVEHCGLCHSDLSMLEDEWGIAQYPAVLGHEALGRVAAVGPAAK